MENSVIINAMKDAGCSDELFKFIANDKDLVEKMIEAGNVFLLREYTKYRDNEKYNSARKVLGRDFISPNEIAEHWKLAYAKEQLQHFSETLPSENIIHWLRDNDYVLIPGPPRASSFSELCKFDTKLFSNFLAKKYIWIWKEKFAYGDKVECEWLMISKKVIDESKKNSRQQPLSEVEYIPNAAEIVWCNVTHRKVRGAWLFTDWTTYVKTSSVGSLDDTQDEHINVTVDWEDNEIVMTPYDYGARLLPARKRTS